MGELRPSQRIEQRPRHAREQRRHVDTPALDSHVAPERSRRASPSRCHLSFFPSWSAKRVVFFGGELLLFAFSLLFFTSRSHFFPTTAVWGTASPPSGGLTRCRCLRHVRRTRGNLDAIRYQSNHAAGPSMIAINRERTIFRWFYARSKRTDRKIVDAG